MNRIDRLYMEMIHYYQGDPKHIQHFVKVHDLSRLIGQSEGLDEDTMYVLEAAALVHDIGIKPGEEKFGRSDGKIQEEEVNSYDTSGKTAFVYNRPKTIQQIIDDLSGETAKTNTEALSAASTTKKAIEGSWTSYTGNDPSMEYSSKYTLVFNSDGTVSCKGYKNNHSGNYEVESDGTIVCSFTKCIDSFPPNGPTEIQGYTAKFVLNSDGTLTSPTGSNGTTNWGKNTTWTKVQ